MRYLVLELGSYAYEIYLHAQMVEINIYAHSDKHRYQHPFFHQELCIQLNQAT